MRTTVRRAVAADAAALAAFRWGPVEAEHPDAGMDRAGFVAAFSRWMIEHPSTHLPFVAEVDGDVVGMAWLMVAERVPGADRPYRRFGDVQSVYVVPELRDSGVGTALLTELLAEAARLGLEHVTVHSSDRAVTFYERLGFGHDRQWLRWQPR